MSFFEGYIEKLHIFALILVGTLILLFLYNIGLLLFNSIREGEPIRSWKIGYELLDVIVVFLFVLATVLVLLYLFDFFKYLNNHRGGAGNAISGTQG